MPHGKICYVELPATDVERSAAFYRGLFGWKTRRRGDGALAFDDEAGYVSGAFTSRRAAASCAPGLLVYVMVDSIEDTLARVVPLGGQVIQPVGHDGPELTARIQDPGGNILGLYQEPRPKQPG